MPTPNNGLGRPRGAINHASRELKEFWHEFFTSQEYRDSARRRIINGSAPHLEGYLFNKIYGKPKENVEVLIGPLEDELSKLSLEELAQRAEDMVRSLREAEDVGKQIAPYIDVEVSKASDSDNRSASVQPEGVDATTE